MKPDDKPSLPAIKITFFGDSTCVGQGVSLYQGWVTKIAKYFGDYGQEINREILVTNSSINGRTTRQALEDMPYHIQGHGPDILVIQFGLNDCNHWATDRGLPRVSLPAFIANLQEIISRGVQFGARRILLNNNHPTSRNKAIMPGTTMTFEASNEKYNAAIRALAAELPSLVLFQDIEAYFKAGTNCPPSIEEFLLGDGLHLSAAGHDQYYRLLRPVLRTALDAVIAEETRT